MADITEINAMRELSIARGYHLPYKEGTLPLHKMNFVLTDGPERNETTPNAKDLQRTLDEIAEARRQANIVLVSLHSHEMLGRQLEMPPQFIQTFAHACIDAGASVIIGHGPHVLRGVEVYNGGAIFYSLGNFIFQADTVALQPYDAYDGKNLPQSTSVGAYMDFRYKNGTAGDVINPEIWRTVLASWTIENGRITEMTLYPCDLGMSKPRPQRGSPTLIRSEETIRIMQALSKPFGTKIKNDGGLGRIVLS